MSQQGAVAFLTKALADASIMVQMEELARTSDDPAAAISNFAALMEFEVTGPEFTEMVDQLAKIESGELSLDELKDVSGGLHRVGGEWQLRLLELQQEQPNETRSFGLLSNIMKAKRSVGKAMVNNVR